MNSDLSVRELMRIADTIRHELQRLRTNQYRELGRHMEELMSGLERTQTIRRQLVHCANRNWHLSAAKLTNQASQQLRELPYLIGELERALDRRPLRVPSPRELLAELEQARQEFGELRHYPEDQAISVVTEAIELDGVYLGEFEIQLCISGLAEIRNRRPHRIIALDPHPAACNSAVTHPHVSDEHLCAGDGYAAVEAALLNGRICDFFLLVRSVLTHYNPGSPYVALADWDGMSCSDCGHFVSEDETYVCQSCEETFCSECSSYCFKCETTMCLGCLETCSVCDDPVCPLCMTRCHNCDRLLCSSCMENEGCPCEEPEEESDDETDEPTTDQTAVPAGPTRLGQTG